MAAFNPQVQPGGPDMPNYDRQIGGPISDLVPDKSSGIAYQTVGNALEEGVQVADQDVKKQIDTDTRNTVEPIRDSFTNTLKQVRDSLSNNNILPENASSTSGGSQPVPTAINSGINKVDAIQSAMINGKINDTYYHARLKDAVTSLRSQYPGYTDYIDQRVSQITGVNPANAYVQDLMQDINRMSSTKKSAVDKAIDDAMKSGYPNSSQMIDALRQRGDSFLPAFQQWYAGQTELDAGIKRKAALRADTNASKEDIKTQRTQDWTNEVGAGVQSNLDTMVKISGLDQPQNILTMLQTAANNPSSYTADQYRQLAAQINAQKAVLERQYTSQLNRTAKDSQGHTYSYASDIGTQQGLQIMRDQLSVYDTMSKALLEGGPQGAGLAFWTANHARSVLDQAKSNLLDDKTLGDFTAKTATFNELYGPNWTNLVTQQSLRNDIDKNMRAYLDSKQMDARLGTGVTMKQHMDEAADLEKKGKITGAMRSKYVGNLVNIVDDIKNPQAPQQDKENVMRYLFSPEGQGILNGIRTEYKDPVTNKVVPGKYSVFTRLSSQDVVKEVAKMPDDVKLMYKNYMEREAFGELFYKEFQNLNHFTGHDNLAFHYNDGSKGGVPFIELRDNEGALASPVGKDSRTYTQRPPSDSYIWQVKANVDRINQALYGMNNIEKAFGGNASDYVLSRLIQSQVDLGKNWDGLPKQLIDQIAATRGKRKLEETFSGQKRGAGEE